MERRAFLAAAVLPFWNAALAQDATGPRTTSRVVERLRRISLDRRARWSGMPRAGRPARSIG